MNRAEMEKLFDVAGALAEANKPPSQVQIETALKWAGRAVVAYRGYAVTRLVTLRDWAVECFHEAIEHAALAMPDDGGETLRTIGSAVADEIARLGVVA